MPEGESFTTTLVRLLQSGAYQAWLGCPAGACTQVEFRLQQVYHVHVAKRHLVIREQDVEIIRRQIDGKWHWARPTVCQTRRIVLDRRTGQILKAPSLGVLKTASTAHQAPKYPASLWQRFAQRKRALH